MHKFKLNVSIIYPVQCMMQRGRTPQTVYLSGKVPVEIPSVTHEETQTAVKIVSSHYGQETVRERLHFDGALYNIGATSRYMNGGETMLEHLADNAIRGQDVFRSNRHRISARRADPLGDLPLNVDTVIENGYEAAVEDVRRHAASIILIDGKVFELAKAPMFEVRFTLAGNAFAGGMQSQLSLEERASGNAFIFTPGRLEEAKQFLNAFALNYNASVLKAIYFPQDNEELRIDVWDTELIGPVHEREIAAATGAAYVLSGAGAMLDTLDPSCVEALGRLAHLRKAAANGDSAAPDAILREFDVIALAQCALPQGKTATVSENIGAGRLARALEIGRAGIVIAPAPVIASAADIDGLSYSAIR